MLSCKETFHLISLGLDQKFPWRRRLAIRLHLLMCSACRAYQRQLESLHRLTVEHFRKGRSLTVAPRSRLSEKARERINTALRK
ncbi:MAG: zf-HC2 domain-containing protein [Planctomycetes bacterium]|nr:zf-HC2 domain-containing protein [Planctomycetota bacterium]